MADQVLPSGSTQQDSELERRRDGQFRVCMSCAVVVAAFGSRWPPDRFAELHKGLYGRSIVPEMATQVHHAAPDRATNP